MRSHMNQLGSIQLTSINSHSRGKHLHCCSVPCYHSVCKNSKYSWWSG